MKVEYVSSSNTIVINLLGTPVKCTDNENPRNGEGSIWLTDYGARKLAYSLLDAVTDLEHYRYKKL